MKKFFLSFLREKACKNLRGVTLIELILYIGFSFFVIASIFAAFVHSNRRFIEQRVTSRTVDDVREAVNILAREMRKTGHKFYLFRDAGRTVEGIIPGASFADGSSFLFSDNTGANGFSDNFTIRFVPISPNGLLTDQNNNPTTNPANAVVHEVTYSVNGSRLERRLQRLNSNGTSIGSPITNVITDDVVGFQVEFGLLGINNEISPASHTAIGVWTSNSPGITITPGGENDIRIAGSTQNFDLAFTGRNGTGFPIRSGSKYTLFFDMREASTDLRFVNCAVIVRAGTTEFELSNIGFVGRQYASDPIRLVFESPIDHNNAEIVFRFTMNGANHNMHISTLRFREDRKGSITWVGGTQGRSIWNEAVGRTGRDSINYLSYFRNGTPAEWEANKQHARLARVSVLTRAARAQTRVEDRVFQFGNVSYNTETQNTSEFEHRLHSTVVSLEDNGVFPRGEDGTMFFGEQVERPPGAGNPAVVSAPAAPPTSPSPTSPPPSSPPSVPSSPPASAPPATPPQTFNINIINQGAGSTDPPLFSAIPSGQNVTVRAIPQAGNIFVRWEGNPINNQNTNPITFSVLDNYTITAVFTPARAITNNIPAPFGILEVNGVSLASGTSLTVAQGSTNSFRFIPIANYTWSRWTGDLSTQATSNPINTFVVENNVSVTAVIQGLQGRYSFENNMNDSSIFARHGSATNVAFANSCVGTRGAVFNGTNSHIDIGNYNLEGNQLTLAAWVRLDSLTGNDQVVISKGTANTSAGTEWSLAITNSRTVRLRLRREGQANAVDHTVATPALTLRRWHHIAAVYDGAAVRIHIDGSQIAPSNSAATGNIAQSINRVWIGGQPGNPTGNPFRGVIDDVRIFNRALSATEVNGLHSAGSSTCISYTLTISATNGSVTVNGAPYTAPLSFGAFSQVTLQATPNTGHTFTGWSGDLTGTANPATVTMDRNRTITANFAPAGTQTPCNQNLTVFTDNQAISWSNHDGWSWASTQNQSWYSHWPGFGGNAHNANFNGPNVPLRSNEMILASNHNFRNGTIAFGFAVRGNAATSIGEVRVYLRDANNNRSVSILVPNHLEPGEPYSFAASLFTPQDAGFNIEMVRRIGFSFTNPPNWVWTEFWWDNVAFTCGTPSSAPPSSPPPSSAPGFACNLGNSTRFAHNVNQRIQPQPGFCAVYTKPTGAGTPLRLGNWTGVNFTAEFMDSQGNRVPATTIINGQHTAINGLASGDIFMHIISSSGAGNGDVQFNSW